MKPTFLLVFLMMMCMNTLAQSKLLFTNAKTIDVDRYNGFKGDPYMWSEWHTATIYDNKGDEIPDVEINFNGYTNELEVRSDDKFIELDQRNYATIETTHDNKPIVLSRGHKGFFMNGFIEVIYEGESISMLRKFEAKLEEIEIQNVGKTERIKRFNTKYLYYLIAHGEVKKVSLKKKKLLEALGRKKEMSTIIDSGLLKTNRLDHLKEILEYFESL